MKTKQAKRHQEASEDAIAIDTTQTIFSSDLLTPEEERTLLATFWECKSELVRLLIRHFPKLRAQRPVLEEAVEEDGAAREGLERLLEDPAEGRVVVDDPHGAAAEDVARPHEEREAEARPHGQPLAAPSTPLKRRVALGAGRYVTGDHRDTPSIQGALFSGRRCGEAVVADLRA